MIQYWLLADPWVRLTLDARHEFTKLELVDRHGLRNVLKVNRDDSADAVRTFANRVAVVASYDPGVDICWVFGQDLTPETGLVGRDGNCMTYQQLLDLYGDRIRFGIPGSSPR